MGALSPSGLYSLLFPRAETCEDRKFKLKYEEDGGEGWCGQRGNGSLPKRGVTRAEPGNINKHSLAEEVMWVAKATKAGDSRPAIGECWGTGHEGRTEGREAKRVARPRSCSRGHGECWKV